MPFAMATNRRGPQRLCIRTCSISPGGLSSRGHFVSTRPYRTEQTLQLLDARCRGTPPCFFSSLFRGTAPVPCFPEHPPHTPSTCLSTQHLPFHEAKCWPPRERATWGVGRSHHGPGPSAQPLRRDSVAPQSWSQRSRSRVSVTSSSCSDRWNVLPCLPHCQTGGKCFRVCPIAQRIPQTGSRLFHWGRLLQGYMDSHLLGSRIAHIAVRSRQSPL